MILSDIELMFSSEKDYVGEYSYRISVTPQIMSANSTLVGNCPTSYWFLKDRDSANRWYEHIAYQSIMYSKHPCKISLEGVNFPGRPLKEDVVS